MPTEKASPTGSTLAEGPYQVPSEKAEQYLVETVEYKLNQVDVAGLAADSLSFRSKATMRMAIVTFTWGLSVAAFAVDGSVLSGLASMETFRDYYHTKTSGGEWGFIIAVYSIGNIVASCFQWGGDIIGRRGIAFVGAVLLAIGCAIQAAAPNKSALIGGRFLAGGGSALTASIGPTYMAEVSPSCYRGLAVGIYCSCYYLGAIVIAGVLLGASYMEGDWSFRMPLVFQIGPPVLVAILLYTVTPESPRWLAAHGKVDEAREVIAKYQTNSERLDDPVVNATMDQIISSLELIENKPWDYTTFLKNSSGRYRLWIIFLYSFFQQWNGGGMMGYFLPGILELVGITNTQQQLGINLGMVGVNWAATLVSANYVDRVTRRFILINTMTMFCIFLALMALVGGLYVHGIGVKTMGILTIVFIYAFNICIGLFLNVLHNIYPTEVLHYSQRAKGMGLYSLFQSSFGFAMTYGGSAMLAALGWKIYFVFFGINLLCMFLAWRFFPEFRFLSLEEIDLVFETEGADPVKLSLQLQKAKKRKHDERNQMAKEGA